MFHIVKFKNPIKMNKKASSKIETKIKQANLTENKLVTSHLRGKKNFSWHYLIVYP